MNKLPHKVRGDVVQTWEALWLDVWLASRAHMIQRRGSGSPGLGG